MSSDAVRLYLASTSPARLATLRTAGIEPVPLPPGVDEDAAVAAAGPLAATEMVMLLARLKAEAVAAAHPELDGLILGGDSAFELDGVVYGKPHLPDVARERWRAQRGRFGMLHSGHWLIDTRTGRAVGAPAVARVEFASDITDSEIDAYIATGEPLEVAGAFTIDARGAAFIERIEGDPHAVVGLSIPLLRTLVRSLALEWTDLWT
ncbi:MAG TPA: nucleoside triphosphate pyrophosphatase [Pseudolysinimonas sp.]|nr:nucleoside triphosphate pyrophosphatase [Pseudolysinimonas sp.]